MAADDDQKDAESDPWSSIESEGLPDLAGEFGFSFDDASGGDAEPAADEAAAESPTDQSADAQADAEIDSWLDESADEADAGAGDSAVQIGTGESGISTPSSVGGFDEPADDVGTEAGSAWGDAEAAGEWSTTEADPEWSGTDGDDWSASAGLENTSAAARESDVLDGADEAEGRPAAVADESFAAVDEAAEHVTGDESSEVPGASFAAATSRPAAPSRPRAKAKRRKAGGIGQMLGVVLGGAMAIPITMAILIWGLQKDPFKVTEIAWVQDYGGFLLPEKFRAGGAKKPGPKQGGSPLDQIPDVVEPAAGASTEPVPETAAVEPDSVAVVPAPEEPPAPPPAPPAPPEPEPLDTAALDDAVAAASTALEAVLAVDDPEDPARKKLLVKCYKALAKMADELAQLERTAADTGRPLAGPPEAVSALHDRMAARPALRDDLAGLAVAWLKFPNRGSDGIFLQLKFGKARRVGPYWCSDAKLQEPDGERDITMISRSEPSAVRGDVLAVTGLVMDDDVIWAADLRPATGASGLSAP